MEKNSPRRTSVWMLGLAAFAVAGIVPAAPPVEQPSADDAPAHRAAPAAPGAERPAQAAPLAAPAPFASGFEGYRPYRADEPLRPWREVNDEAGGLGGHVGQLQSAGRPGMPRTHH